MTSPLIAAADLAHLLATRPTDVRVIDCRFNLADPTAGQAAWREGHIPGALYAHLDHDLSGTKTGHNGRHPMPAIADLTATARGWGIGPGTRVIAYDASGGMFAARLWWMLRWLGHESVAVLDGGWPKWDREKRPCSAEVPHPLPSVYSARTDGKGGGWVDTAYVLSHLEAQDMLIVDARSPERFRGEAEPIDPVAGRIPGAVCRFFKQNLDAEGCFRPAAELRADFVSILGAHRPEHAVNSCGSGVSACHNLLAMEIAGLTGSRLYPGSWSEWCADPARPYERGARG